MTRFIAIDPQAPDGRPFIVLGTPTNLLPGPNADPLWIVESSHLHLCDAQAALRDAAAPRDQA